MRALANAPRHSGFRLTSHCGAAICMAMALATASPALLAVEASSATSNQQSFSVAAGPLASALSSLAQQSGINLSFAASQVQGVSSPGARNAPSIDTALAQLLSGTGLVAQKSSSGYVVVAAQTDSSAYRLNPLTVEAQRTQSGVAPVPGYFASTSRTATKTDTPVLETPQSISVVTAEQIADRKAGTVEEAVAYSAGVSVGGAGLDPRFDQINIRGYAAVTNADYLDGMRQANSGWLSYFATDPFALERIEILKGPASVLYGQISPGGMVNRVSKRPSEEAVEQVELQYGSNDHMQGQFDIGGRLNENGDVLYRLVAIARDADTDIEQVPNNVGLIAPSLTWRFSEQTDLTLLAQYQDRETSGSPRPYQSGDTLTHFWAGDEDFDKLDQQQAQFGYEFEHRFNDTFSLQHNLRYGTTDTVNQYTSASLQAGSTSVLDRTAWGIYEQMDSVTTDTRLVSHFATGALDHTLLTGLDYAYLDFDVEYSMGVAPSIDINNPDYHQPIARPRSVLVDQSGTTHRSAVYLQDQVAVGAWRLSAGLRQDWANTEKTNNLNGIKSKTHDDKTTGQLGALYLFDSGLAPYASYAQSFLPQTGTGVGGDDFKPTEGEQFELGIKYQPPGSSTLLTASLYHLVQSNSLTTLPGTAFSVQKGEETSRGLELEAVSDLGEDLHMIASYAFNDAEVTESNDGDKGNTPILTPRHLASLWLDYTLPRGALQGLGLSAGARYNGRSYANASNTEKNEAYTLVDVAAHYDLRGSADGIRLGLNARNVTDKRYISCEAGYCYRGAGRALIGSVSYRW